MASHPEKYQLDGGETKHHGLELLGLRESAAVEEMSAAD
jgi:hypothetical protein